MGQAELRSPSVLSSRVGHVVKEVANSNVKTEVNNQLSGATEPPLPVTPERLELIKAYAKSRERGADEMATSRIAKRFAPRAPAVPLSRDYRSGAFMPLTSPFFALASRIRTLTAVLIIAALLPNLTLAVLWLGLIDPPWSDVAAPPPKESPAPAVQSANVPPVLSAPNMIEASAGGTVGFPMTLDGTDGVPDRSIIVIKGLPPGSALSDGYANGETEWRLKPDQIGDLHVALPDTAIGESKISVELVAPDRSIIATAATTLRTRANATPNIDPYGTGETTQALDIAAGAPEVGVEERFEVLDAVSIETVESMPLPDRRPAPPINIAAASWIRPTAYVNLREAPSSTASVVSIVAKGVKLRVTGRKRGWVQVSNPATSDSGWIYAGNVNALR